MLVGVELTLLAATLEKRWKAAKYRNPHAFGHGVWTCRWAEAIELWRRQEEVIDCGDTNRSRGTLSRHFVRVQSTAENGPIQFIWSTSRTQLIRSLFHTAGLVMASISAQSQNMSARMPGNRTAATEGQRVSSYLCCMMMYLVHREMVQCDVPC